MVHPFQEAPFQEVEIACRQAENQQDRLMAGILEAYPVEELAYLSNWSELMSFTLRSYSKHTRWEAGHSRRRLETWWQTLWKWWHACKSSVSKTQRPSVNPSIRTSREPRRHTTRRHRESRRKTSRRHHASGRTKPRRRGVQHRIVRGLALGRV